MQKRKKEVRKDSSPTRFRISTVGIASEFDEVFVRLSDRMLKTEHVLAMLAAKMLKLEAKDCKPGYKKSCSAMTPGEKKARRMCSRS